MWDLVKSVGPYRLVATALFGLVVGALASLVIPTESWNGAAAAFVVFAGIAFALALLATGAFDLWMLVRRRRQAAKPRPEPDAPPVARQTEAAEEDADPDADGAADSADEPPQEPPDHETDNTKSA